MTAAHPVATTATSLASRAGFEWDPSARVPDWVVLGRIRDRICADLPVTDDVCPAEDVGAYVPALLAAGHTHSEIYRATGVKAERHDQTSPRRHQ